VLGALLGVIHRSWPYDAKRLSGGRAELLALLPPCSSIQFVLLAG